MFKQRADNHRLGGDYLPGGFILSMEGVGEHPLTRQIQRLQQELHEAADEVGVVTLRED